MTELKKATRIVLILGIAFRIYCALSRTDIVWPDEHYHTLEPAGKVVWGFGFLPWEWAEHYRSWIGPGIFVPLFFLLKWLGFTGGPVAICCARLFVASFSGFSLIIFDRWLSKLKVSDFAHWFGLSVFALHSSLILWGVTTLTDHFALISISLVFPYLFTRPSGFLSGVLLGLSFMVRLQSIALMPGYGLYLLLQRTKWKDCLRLSAGYLVCIFFSGALDWLTLGKPFESTIVQLTRGMQIAEKWGKMRWSQYFYNFLADLGPIMCIASIAALFLSFQLKQYRKLWYFVSLPAFSFFLIHMGISHKETRFMLPVYFMIMVWITLGAEWCWQAMRSVQKDFFHRFGLKITLVVAVLSFWRVTAARNYTTGRDDFDLEARARSDGRLLRSNSEKCLFTLGRHWSWDRAQLMQGTVFRYIEINAEQIGDITLPQCPYAIAKDTTLSTWNAHGWIFLQHSDRSDFILLKKEYPGQ